MNTSDLLIYRLATVDDCDSIAFLLNNSYRSELAQQGWTNENELIDGLRTSSNALIDIINNNDSIILIFFDKNQQILIGCVYLKHKSEIKTAYLGMLAVRPDFQNRGYGKFIITIAENYVLNQWNIDYVELTTIIQRSELVDYYKRRGYIDTGIRQAFQPSSSSRLLRNDLQLCIMRKFVKNNQETITNTIN